MKYETHQMKKIFQYRNMDSSCQIKCVQLLQLEQLHVLQIHKYKYDYF